MKQPIKSMPKSIDYCKCIKPHFSGTYYCINCCKKLHKLFRKRKAKIVTSILLIAIISCSKDNTITPIHNTSTPIDYSTHTTPHYYTSTFVRDSMIGQWSIYKLTYIGADTTYESYQPQPYHTITISINTMQYNNTTPEVYTYNNFNIQSLTYNYYVVDMYEDRTWMYVLDSNIVPPIGIDTVYYSLARL